MTLESKFDKLPSRSRNGQNVYDCHGVANIEYRCQQRSEHRIYAVGGDFFISIARLKADGISMTTIEGSDTA